MSSARTEAERLVSDIVNVEGELVPERRLAIAQTYIDTLRAMGAADESRRCRAAAAMPAGWCGRCRKPLPDPTAYCTCMESGRTGSL